MTTASEPKQIHKKVVAIDDNGHVFDIRVELHYIRGNHDSYFSVTASEWLSSRGFASGLESSNIAGGCLHEDILRLRPDLGPVVALNLAYANGEPMHAKENGWYWYSDYDGKGTGRWMPDATPRERAAHHLRIEPDELAVGLTREQFDAFVDTLADQWQVDAELAIALIEAL